MAEKRKRGRPAKAKSQLFSLRLPVGLHRELRHHALDEGKPLNEILVEVIEAWWKKKAQRRSRRR